MEERKYLVQGILIDDDVQTVTESFYTDDYEQALDFIMQKHKFSHKYVYNVLDVKRNELIISTSENKYWIY